MSSGAGGRTSTGWRASRGGGDRRALERLVESVARRRVPPVDAHALASGRRRRRDPGDRHQARHGPRVVPGEASFRTWALAIAANHLRTTRRRRAEAAAVSFEAFGEDLAQGLDTPYDAGGVDEAAARGGGQGRLHPGDAALPRPGAPARLHPRRGLRAPQLAGRRGARHHPGCPSQAPVPRAGSRPGVHARALRPGRPVEPLPLPPAGRPGDPGGAPRSGEAALRRPPSAARARAAAGGDGGPQRTPPRSCGPTYVAPEASLSWIGDLLRSGRLSIVAEPGDEQGPALARRGGGCASRGGRCEGSTRSRRAPALAELDRALLDQGRERVLGHLVGEPDRGGRSVRDVLGDGPHLAGAPADGARGEDGHVARLLRASSAAATSEVGSWPSVPSAPWPTSTLTAPGVRKWGDCDRSSLRTVSVTAALLRSPSCPRTVAPSREVRRLRRRAERRG